MSSFYGAMFESLPHLVIRSICLSYNVISRVSCRYSVKKTMKSCTNKILHPANVLYGNDLIAIIVDEVYIMAVNIVYFSVATT